MPDGTLPILIPLVVASSIGAWAMLSLMGGERERRLVEQRTAEAAAETLAAQLAALQTARPAKVLVPPLPGPPKNASPAKGDAADGKKPASKKDELHGKKEPAGAGAGKAAR